MKKIRRWWPRLLIAGLLVCGFLFASTRTVTPAMPARVSKEARHLMLAGQPVSVTLYFPAARGDAPLVVVAHGFTRSKRYMAGWGVALAREGFIAAVPTQPALADHELNARVLAELVSELRSGKITSKVKAGPKSALMGFSMGGLTTMLAAGKQPVDAWVGLDPVGMDDSWLHAGKTVTIPCAVLRAEPQAWNKYGNARDVFAVLPGPKFSLKIRGATHLDAESPTDFLGQLTCGRADASRRATFERYAIAFLKATLMDDADARRILDGAKTDSALDEVQDERQRGP